MEDDEVENILDQLETVTDNQHYQHQTINTPPKSVYPNIDLEEMFIFGRSTCVDAGTKFMAV